MSPFRSNQAWWAAAITCNVSTMTRHSLTNATFPKPNSASSRAAISRLYLTPDEAAVFMAQNLGLIQLWQATHEQLTTIVASESERWSEHWTDKINRNERHFQFAFNRRPVFARKAIPPRRALTGADAPAQLVGIAQPGRLRLREALIS
jgi:hypothetical protein